MTMAFPQSTIPQHAIDPMSAMSTLASDATTSSTKVSAADMPPLIRSTPASCATPERVLALPELLEHILQFLPRNDLVQSQRVCKRFKHAVESSIKIQRDLFLEPLLWAGPDPKLDMVNRLHTRRDGTSFQSSSEDTTHYPIVDLNPLFFEEDSEHEFYNGNSPGEDFTTSVWFTFDKEAMRSNHVYCRMALTRPLVPGMEMDTWHEDLGYYTMQLGEEPVTLAVLYKAEKVLLDEQVNGWGGDEGNVGQGGRDGDDGTEQAGMGDQHDQGTNDDDERQESEADHIYLPSDVTWRVIFPAGVRFRLLGKQWPEEHGKDAMASLGQSDVVSTQVIED